MHELDFYFGSEEAGTRADRLVFCERTTRWVRAGRVAARTRLAAGRNPVSICETRSHAEMRGRLRDSPSDSVAIEAVRETFGPTLDFIAEIRQDFPEVFVTALLAVGGEPDALAECEIGLREAGAAEIVRSVWDVDRLLRRVERHRELWAAARPAASDSFWQGLPWPDDERDRF